MWNFDEDASQWRAESERIRSFVINVARVLR